MGFIERAWTGHAGIQRLQWVQVGSSTKTKISIKVKALTGHKATQAAQPKHRSSSTTKLCCSSLAMVVGRGSISQTSPTPSFPLER